MALTTLDKVKLRLRISHSKLDSDITSMIDAAKLEMERAGLVVVDEDDPLIQEAIKAYCLYNFTGDEKTKNGYFKSWEYQLDCLRKAEGYGYVQ